MAKHQSVSLAVVESDEPATVTMYGALGLEIRHFRDIKIGSVQFAKITSSSGTPTTHGNSTRPKRAFARRTVMPCLMMANR